MSEQVEAQVPSPELDQNQNVDVSDLTSRLEALENSNKRLLEESKQWKSKYQTVRSEVDNREREALESQNDFKGLYERAMSEQEALKSQLTENKKKNLRTSLQYEVAKHGSDAQDVEILLAAVQTKKKDLIQYDNEDGSWKGIDLAVDELRKSHAGLFKQDLPGFESGRPSTVKVEEKTVSELLREDSNAVLKDVFKKHLS